jgi:hypothetical protein
MAGLEKTEGARLSLCGLVTLYLKAVESKKGVVAKLGMRYKDIVVGVGYDRISERFVKLLDLLGRKSSVRKIGVAVKISLVEISILGEQKFFHMKLL